MNKPTLVLIWDLLIAGALLGVTYVITKYDLSDYVVWLITLWLCYLIFVVLYKDELEKDDEDELDN